MNADMKGRKQYDRKQYNILHGNRINNHSPFWIVFYIMYDEITVRHWIPQTIAVGIIIISLAARAGINDDYDTKVEKSIESTITANYNDVLNYHNEEDNKTFASGDSKYTFDYDKKTKTLIVFTGSKVDAVFVDGVKQKGEK